MASKVIFSKTRRTGRIVREGAAIPARVPADQEVLKARMKNTLTIRARKLSDILRYNRELGSTYKEYKDIFSVSLENVVVDVDNQFALLLRVFTPKAPYPVVVEFATIAPKDAMKRLPTRNGILIALKKVLCSTKYAESYEVSCGRYKFNFKKLDLIALKAAIEFLKITDTTNNRSWLAPLIDLMITLEAELVKNKQANNKRSKYNKNEEPSIGHAIPVPHFEDDFVEPEPPEVDNAAFAAAEAALDTIRAGRRSGLKINAYSMKYTQTWNPGF